MTLNHLAKTLALTLLASYGALSHAGNDTEKKPSHNHAHAAKVSQTPPMYRKPGPSIRVAEPKIIKLAPYTNETVKISFAGDAKGRLFLSARPKAGITLASEKNEWVFDLDSEKPEIELNVKAGNIGKYYIMFHARVEEKENTQSKPNTGTPDSQTRVFGIPVHIGNVANISARSKPAPKHMIMKAEETVEQKK